MRKPNTAKAGYQAADLRQRAARARDAAGRFIRCTAPVEPDPVYALIEGHRSAYTEWDRLSAVWNDMEVDAPGYREAVAASRGPARREVAAYEALFSARPTTLAGIAALGAHLGKAIREASSFEQPTDGERALAAISSALQRLVAPDMGIPMSASAGPETGFPATGGRIEGRLLAPEHDLSALSIVELARLYPVLVRVEEVMGSAECAPCFLDDSQMQRTPAGHIINREADRLSQFTSAIAREMGRRRPADDDEAEERANTLLSHMVLSGGVAEHPKLIAEINAAWGA